MTSTAGRLPEPYGSGTANLADILERALDKGVVIAGDIRINLLDIELLTIKLRLLVASVDKAKEMGIDWWEHDPSLSSGARRRELAQENERLHRRIAELERSREEPREPEDPEKPEDPEEPGDLADPGDPEHPEQPVQQGVREGVRGPGDGRGDGRHRAHGVRRRVGRQPGDGRRGDGRHRVRPGTHGVRRRGRGQPGGPGARDRHRLHGLPRARRPYRPGTRLPAAAAAGPAR